MNWEAIVGISIIVLIIFMKQFGGDIIESTNWHKNKRKEGQKRWEWVTTPPYFTLRKILYWIFIVIVLSVYIYLGFQIESMM